MNPVWTRCALRLKNVCQFGFVVAIGILASVPSRAVCPTFGLPSGSEIAELQTSEGQICIELLRSDAPITVLNFTSYILRGDYDGTILHRSAPGFVIQGGAYKKTTNSLNVIPTDPRILNEPCTIRPGDLFCASRGNDRGTIAMARIGGQVHSATNQFFINLADNRLPLDSVDQGFTVFGNVLGTGMAVADGIAGLPIVPKDDGWWLAPQIGTALDSLPVRNAVPLFPTPFGCWDPTNLALIVDPLNHIRTLPDPIFGGSLYPLSGSCGTQIPRFTFTQDSGPPGCTALDILGTGVTGLNSLLIRNDPATMDFLQFEFTCPDVSEALNQRGLWRTDYGTRLASELVVIQSANYQPVPEPGFAWTLLAGMFLLRVFVRTRRSTLGSISGQHILAESGFDEL